MAARDDHPPMGPPAPAPAPSLSRRQLLRRASALGGAAVFGGALASLLAACGGGTASSPTTSTTSGTSSTSTSTSTTSSTGGSTPAAGAAATPSAAAASTSTTSTTSTTASGSVQRGGSLTWAYSFDVMKIDPIWSDSLIDETAFVQVVEAMARANKDGSGVEPAVAQKWDVSADGLTYTFHLRPNVKFHNGTAVTADDVVASLKRNQTMGNYSWQLKEVSSIDKVDDQTVKITLTTKVASFLARIAVPSNGVFPASQIQQTGKNEITQPIATGPFMVKEWVHNDHLTLAKNPNYWDMAPDGQPYPYLDQVTIKQVAEVTTSVLQVQSGQIDGMDRPDYSQIGTLKSDSRGQLLTFPQQQVYFMTIQLARPPFDDVKVRQALSLALDRKVFVDRVTGGLGQIANSFFPKGTLGWDPDLTLPFDLNKAKQLMSQSKYPNGYKGVAIECTSGDRLANDNAVLAQQMWAPLGIEVTIQQIEGSTLAASWYKGDFTSIAGYQWTNGMADPDQLVQFFFITPRMNAGYQPSQDAVNLVSQAAQELDPEKRKQDYYQLQQIYNQDVGGTISLYFTPLASFMSKKVQGFYRTPLGFPLWYQTWLSK